MNLTIVEIKKGDLFVCKRDIDFLCPDIGKWRQVKKDSIFLLYRLYPYVRQQEKEKQQYLDLKALWICNKIFIYRNYIHLNLFNQWFEKIN